MRAILAATSLEVLAATNAGITASSLSGRIYSISEFGTGWPPIIFHSSLEPALHVEEK
jgi:hypothetical protein